MSYKILRPIAVIVLFFFSWTFLGIYNLAYAYKNSPQQSALSGQPKEQKPEERFEKSIRDVEDTINKLKKVKTHEEREAEKEGLRTKRQEIEGHDAEIRRQFQETEEKIKGLPDEIKQRHKDFVKKYEENLNTLRRNLDDIEKAETAEEVKVEVEKAKTFLEKTKPPSRHTPLDPNKLPHRTPEIKKKEPRTRSEEFSREQGAKGIAQRQKPILVASIGNLQGILTNAATQALPPPTQADLSETIEIQFTQQIKDIANQLQNNPVKIYEWVRNNIEFVPTYGSIQGADMCLQTKQCNAFDTASLLIALLRTSNIPAKYVYGTIEIPIDKVMNWVGGFTDANSALNLIASGGIPVSGIISGGKLSAARMEHVWVEAYTGYGPYSGRPSKLNPPKTWLPLDPSFKQYSYTQGIDLQTAVPFDGQGFVNQIKSTATINETESYVTNVDSNYIQTTLTNYQAQLQNYINQNMPNAKVGDILGKKEIIKQELGILPASLPYKTITIGNRYSEISDSLRHKITFDIQDPNFFTTSLSYTSSLPELAGKRITLSYAPATASDEQIINSYGGIYNVPAYLVNLKPQIKVEGVVKVEGKAIGMGSEQKFSMVFYLPNIGSDQIQNDITAGGYYAIGLVPDRLSSGYSVVLKQRAQQLDNFVKAGGDQFSDTGLGEQLYLSIMSYFFEVDQYSDVVASSQNMVYVKQPGEGIFGLSLSVLSIFGVPKSVHVTGTNIDVDRAVYIPFSKLGDSKGSFNFMTTVGRLGSGAEHGIIEQFYATEGISAVKAIYLANLQGLKTFRINSSNMSTILPILQVSEEVKSDIRNAINAGKEVLIPERELRLNDWNGVGYVITDSTTGAGAYMISGGIAGGSGTKEQNLSAVTKEQRSIYCIIGVLVGPVVAVLVLIAMMQFDKILVAFLPLGFFGILVILIYIIMTIALIIALYAAVRACISAADLKRYKWKKQLVFNFSSFYQKMKQKERRSENIGFSVKQNKIYYTLYWSHHIST